MSELQGANTTCFVCGFSYDSEKHLTECLNRPDTKDYTKVTLEDVLHTVDVDLTVGDQFDE